MAEYIEREKAIAEFDKGDLLVGDNVKWAKEILYRTPTADVVEVVKCKDCKYYKAQKQSMIWENKKKYCCRVVALKVNETDYCSYGERRCEDEHL